MTISVTADDIANGGKDCRDCPIALAMTRELKRPVMVGLDVWRFADRDSIGDNKPLPDIAVAFCCALRDNNLITRNLKGEKKRRIKTELRPFAFNI